MERKLTEQVSRLGTERDQLLAERTRLQAYPSGEAFNYPHFQEG
jgi:hypothetical protein